MTVTREARTVWHFDAWFARPAGSAPLAHDSIDPQAAAFVVRELLQTAWEK